MRTTSGKDWIRESKREAIYHRDGDRCLACPRGRNERGRGLSIDHVIPNGDNRETNLVTLCVQCNREKSDRPLEAWRPDLAAKVWEHTAKPLNRKEGLRRAKERRPSRFAQEAFRNSKAGRELAAKRQAERERAAFEGPPFFQSWGSVELYVDGEPFVGVESITWRDG